MRKAQNYISKIRHIIKKYEIKKKITREKYEGDCLLRKEEN